MFAGGLTGRAGGEKKSLGSPGVQYAVDVALKKNGTLVVKGEEFDQKRSQISAESRYGMLEKAQWSYKGNNVASVETYPQPFIR